MNQETGRRGEDLATAYLSSQGFDILSRNWRCKLGELDIVARDGETLVAIEVKTRTTLRAGHPLEAITPKKLHRLYCLLREWVICNGSSGCRLRRVDAMAIVFLPKLTIEYRKEI